MDDVLVKYHKFADKVAQALNDAKVEPPAPVTLGGEEQEEGPFAAVMVVFGDPDSGLPPIAGAINHKPETGWVPDNQVQGGVPV